MRVVVHPTTLGAAGNPYVDHVAEGLRAAGVEVVDFNRRAIISGVDVVHINWPAYVVDWSSRRRALLDAARILAYLNIARRRGTRVVWTAHDLGGHDRRYPRLQRLYERAFAASVTDVISLSAAGVPLLRSRFPGLRRTPIHVVPHGHYGEDYPAPLGREQARERLSLPRDGRIILQFGQLRRYKGIADMIRAFARIDDPQVSLLVVGESKDPDYTRELTELATAVPRVILRPQRADEEEVGLLMSACDVLYAAYPEGTSLNSGVAVLGVSFARPVVVRDTPVLRELGDIVGDGWIVPAAPGADTEALRTALALAEQPRPGPDLAALEWAPLIQAILAVYSGRSTPLSG